jgi:hypothetical protein
VQNLLDDAYLVMEYAVRAGRLPDDSLANAIKDVEAGSKEGLLPSMVTLSKAMNAAVAAITPVTLMDLRTARSPFDKGGPSTRRVQYVLCALTVVLAVLIAFYSFALQREQGALHEYEDVQAAQIAEKTNALRRLVQQDKVLETKDSRYDLYLRNVRELKDLERRRQVNLDLLAALAQEPVWPLEGNLADFTSWLEQRFAARAGAKAPSIGLVDTSTLPASPTEIACDDRGNAKPVVPVRRASYTDEIRADTLDDLCFMQLLDLGFGSVSNYVSVSDVVSPIRDRVMLQSAWILPFLTGLLGATIFLLRDSLDPLTPNLGAPRAVVRLSLGGVAGIIIGWFWTPSGTLGAELASVSSLPLALAFVAGFSIDILFSVLDRIRRAVGSVTQDGTGATGGRA